MLNWTGVQFTNSINFQDTINALLDEEAEEMVGAERYERTADREAYRSGHYKRKLGTSSGEVVLEVPKLRGATFQTAVIERYRRRETSVEEAIIVSVKTSALLEELTQRPGKLL